jgi:ribonuclease P protein component
MAAAEPSRPGAERAVISSRFKVFPFPTMLPKKNKLPIQLFPGKRGKLLKSPYFTLKIFSPEKKFSRFGVTISSKTAPKASDRNRLKRAAFNIFKGLINNLPVADYWLTILSPANGLPKDEYSAKLKEIIYG